MLAEEQAHIAVSRDEQQHSDAWKSFHTLVHQQSRLAPDAVAVIARDRVLTFGELVREADQLAVRLRALGVGPDVLVGLFFERTSNLVVGLLATLMAGGAYVPFDTEYPRTRIALMLDDARPVAVLTDSDLQHRVPECASHVICLDQPGTTVRAKTDDAPQWPDAKKTDLAYVIYTSGSTGTPKGVMIEHGGLSNYLLWAADYYDVRAGTGAPVQSSPAFDLTITSLLLPLSVGRTALLLDQQLGAQALGETLKSEQGFSLVKLTPSHLEVLASQMDAESASGRTRSFVIGGEQLLAENLRFWRQYAPRTRLINEYGPTETVVGCCVYELQPQDPDSGPVPIGRAIANTSLYILDAERRPVPAGAIGELYIGGAGVARGYLNRPDLTRQRFLADPFVPGNRMYKSGDLVRCRPDGVLEFIGRVDDQVKIRGFRVEPGEVQAALVALPEIRDAAVIAREVAPGDARLIAYVVPWLETVPTLVDIRTRLAQHLPEYMIPTSCVVLNELPLTPNGKIDRGALPDHDAVAVHTDSVDPPNDLLELRLAQLCQQILDVPHVGLHDNFFDIGGNSLQAVELFAEIERLTGQKLPVSALFRTPTIATLAAELRDSHTSVSWASLVPIQPLGARRPFFCAHGLGGGVLDYVGIARQLSPDQPVYGIQAPRVAGQVEYFETIEEMASSYINQIRSLQPEGPYLLGGYSMGGVIAYEMAQQLVAQGHAVAHLALFDSQPRTRFSARSFVDAIEEVPYLVANVPRWAADFTQLSPRVKLARVQRKLRAALNLLARPLPGMASRGSDVRVEDVYEDVDRIPEERRRVFEMHLRALRRYYPKPYAGRVTVFKAKIQPLLGRHTPELGWARLALGGVDAHEVSGSHHALLKEPHISDLGRALAVYLDGLGE